MHARLAAPRSTGAADRNADDAPTEPRRGGAAAPQRARAQAHHAGGALLALLAEEDVPVPQRSHMYTWLEPHLDSGVCTHAKRRRGKSGSQLCSAYLRQAKFRSCLCSRARCATVTCMLQVAHRVSQMQHCQQQPASRGPRHQYAANKERFDVMPRGPIVDQSSVLEHTYFFKFIRIHMIPIPALPRAANASCGVSQEHAEAERYDMVYFSVRLLSSDFCPGF